MPSRLLPLALRPGAASLTALALLAVVWPWQAAQAEKADRTKPMVVESDGKQAATVDLAKKLTIVTGNVTIAQGTMLIKADRVEVREPQSGQYDAVARAPVGGAATFRQKRDIGDEWVEAQADRIEYNGATEKVHFIGNAQLRRLHGAVPSDFASASTIVYDQRADTVVFEGGGPEKPGEVPGRARLIFTPKQADAPASGAAP